MELKITKPTLLVNSAIAKSNIKEMLAKAERNKCLFRPHFKTHQSKDIAAWFRELGITRCTVSSLSMAEYFVRYGWKDITIAFPLNILEIDTLNRIAKSASINICIESLEAAEFLNDKLENNIGVFIKIDAGYHRTGIGAESTEIIQQILEVTNQNEKIEFKGFLQHAGHSYHTKNLEEIQAIHSNTINALLNLKRHFIGDYPQIIISVGDTPTCSICEDFSRVNEIRPGNFVFYDVMQYQIGACQLENIAVALACPVVAKHPERNELIIYGGAVHFSKDNIEDLEGNKIFGLVSLDKDNWHHTLENTFIKKLSQEHGTIHLPTQYFDSIDIGDIIYCLPIHSCLTANQMGSYTNIEGQHLEMFQYSSFNSN